MKRNKIFRIIYWLLCLLPVLLIGIGCLIMILNRNYEPGTSINSNLRAVIEDVMLQFGATNMAGNGSDILDTSIYMANGWGLPLLPYFYGIFSTKVSIVAYNQYFIFANWYMSYLLLVSLVAFIPMVLNSFINIAYTLVEKFTVRSDVK